MNLGETIYRLRTQSNMSQGDLADALDVSRQSVSKWENDSAVPELEKLVKMAQLFHVTIDELVTGETAATPSPSVAPAPAAKASMLSVSQILGIVLLALGGLCLIAFTVAGILTGQPLLGLGICAPFVLCGILCLVCRYNPGYVCGLCLYLMASMLLNIFTFGGIGTMAFIVKPVCILFGLWLLLWTLIRFRSDKLRFPWWAKTVFLVLLILSITVTVVSLFPTKSVPAIPQARILADW